MKRLLFSALFFVVSVLDCASSQTTTTSTQVMPDQLVIPAKPGIHDEIQVAGLRDEADPISREQLSDIAAAQLKSEKSFILACIITKEGSGSTLKPSCFDTKMINEYLFDGKLAPSQVVVLERLKKNPSNNLPITDVAYFELSPGSSDFSFLGSLRDFDTPKGLALRESLLDAYTIPVSEACNYIKTHLDELIRSRSPMFFAQAREYIERAVESSDLSCKQWALALLGRMYNQGWGVEKDYSKSGLNFYKVLELHENLDAELFAKVSMANIFMYGWGLPINLPKAYGLLEEVLIRSSMPWISAQANMSMGYLYDKLEYPEHNISMAEKYYKKVIALQDNDFVQAFARAYLGKLLYEKDEYASALTHLEIAASQSLNLGAQAIANMYLGDMYRLGNGVQQDLKTALSFYNKINTRLYLPQQAQKIKQLRQQLSEQLGHGYNSSSSGEES